MAQVVVQVGLILAFPAHYADTPTWVFAVYPLVVFGASLAFLVVMARKKIERQSLQ